MQCPKSFWLHKNNPSLLSPGDYQSKVNKQIEAVFFARDLFPTGSAVKYSNDPSQMIAETQRLLALGEKTIYQATFEYDGVYVICDILRHTEHGWHLYTVKSSTRVKDRHLDDLSFQWFVVNENLPLSNSLLIYINNEYVRRGVLDLKQLFTLYDLTSEIIKRRDAVPIRISRMKELINENGVKQDIGPYCKKYGKDDLECRAKDHCWSHIPYYSVFDIARLGKKAFELYNQGIVTLSDIPANYKLTDPQSFQVKAYKENLKVVDTRRIQTFLSTISYPLYFLDFETYLQMVPLYDGDKPYKQIPFQYSIHSLKSKGAVLDHSEFLAIEGSDPRREIAERLVTKIPKGACTIAYNISFEKMVLKNLSDHFPDLAEHLLDIHDNLVDLMLPFQNKWFYLNEMRGSYSLKAVLTALFPNDVSLNYSHLLIKDGSMAMDTFENLHTRTPEERNLLREALLAYCKLDTYAMVKIWEHLMKQ